MSSSNSIIKPGSTLVADASVAINLVATGRGASIVRALNCSMVTTRNALRELEAGKDKGHDDFVQMSAFIEKGLVSVVTLSDQGTVTYQSLVDGSAMTTLDDGEAATIGYAVEIGGIALIDERKARGLCARIYPYLAVISTAELLLHKTVAEELGHECHVDAVMNALEKARMRVPLDQLSRIRMLIGDERANRCRSLPALSKSSAKR